MCLAAYKGYYKRFETSAKLSLPLINSLITTLNLKIKPI